jgi:hypothetical protein
MVSFTDAQIFLIQTAASTLPVEKRATYLQRMAGGKAFPGLGKRMSWADTSF